jgi:hypothetical protein
MGQGHAAKYDKVGIQTKPEPILLTIPITQLLIS